jgi:hypothetical protein
VKIPFAGLNSLITGKTMKNVYLLILFSTCLTLSSFSQDSTVIVQRGQISKYRKGYLITTSNDTLRGLIWIEGDGALCFIREGIKIKTPVAGNFTKIPYITAGDGYLKAFYRNGIFYEIHNVPPYNNSVFLEALERGPMTLYRLIANYEDAKKADASVNFGGLTGAMTGAMAAASDKPDEEYYSLKAYYVQKQPGNELVLIPKGEKNFREAFYPLIRNNPGFLKGIVGQSFDYYHIRDLVNLYNSTVKRK